MPGKTPGEDHAHGGVFRSPCQERPMPIAARLVISAPTPAPSEQVGDDHARQNDGQRRQPSSQDDMPGTGQMMPTITAASPRAMNAY
jgi:hypothetical protein